MKKQYLSFLFTLLATLLPMKGMAQTAYAVWCEENTTLYFTYRSETLTAGGTFTPEDGSGTKTITSVWSGTSVTATGNYGPSWHSYQSSALSNHYLISSYLTNVVFECSFSSIRPTSTYMWFSECSQLTSIMGIQYLNTSNVTNMGYMFSGCSSLEKLDVSGFDTENVTNMSAMFNSCSALKSLDVNGFETGKVTNMFYMFMGCSSLTSLDVSGFETEKVTAMGCMFEGCSNLRNLDVSTFNTKNVTNLRRMFRDCSGLTSLDVRGFDTENVTFMMGLFQGCSGLTILDLSGWNTMKVTEMASKDSDYGMFSGCTNLATIYVGENWSTDKVTNSAYMFRNCVSLVGGNGTTYNSSYTNKYYAHVDVDGNPGYLTYKSTITSITLDEGTDNQGTLIAFDGLTRNVTANRTIYQDGGWNTLCLPFALTASDITTAFGSGTKVMKLTGDSFDATEKVLTLNFTDVASEGTEAGMPYLIKTGTTGDPLTSLSFSDKTITKTAGEWTGTNVTLHGLLSPTQVVTESSEVDHILFLGENSDFYHPAAYDSSVENSGMMKGMRAYFTVSEDVAYAQARGMGLDDGEVNGMEMKVVDGSEADAPYYTLQGIRVDQPTRGIYIKNGKKVFIK